MPSLTSPTDLPSSSRSFTALTASRPLLSITAYSPLPSTSLFCAGAFLTSFSASASNAPAVRTVSMANPRNSEKFVTGSL